MTIEQIVKNDIEILGEDVVFEVYNNLIKLFYITDTLTEEEKKLYDEEIITELSGDSGLLGFFTNKLPNMVKRLFGKGENIASSPIIATPEAAAAVAKEGAAAAASGGVSLFEKLSNIIGNSGIAGIFTAANLPKVLAVTGGAALVGWILKKIFSRKKVPVQYEEYRELYEDIMQLEEVKAINQMLEESVSDYFLKLINLKTKKESKVKDGDVIANTITFIFNKSENKWSYRKVDPRKTDSKYKVLYNGKLLQFKGKVKDGDRLSISNTMTGKTENSIIKVPSNMTEKIAIDQKRNYEEMDREENLMKEPKKTDIKRTLKEDIMLNSKMLVEGKNTMGMTNIPKDIKLDNEDEYGFRTAKKKSKIEQDEDDNEKYFKKLKQKEDEEDIDEKKKNIDKEVKRVKKAQGIYESKYFNY